LGPKLFHFLGKPKGGKNLKKWVFFQGGFIFLKVGTTPRFPFKVAPLAFFSGGGNQPSQSWGGKLALLGGGPKKGPMCVPLKKGVSPPGVSQHRGLYPLGGGPLFLWGTQKGGPGGALQEGGLKRALYEKKSGEKMSGEKNTP